jgi:type VI secretion system protein ImpB
MAHQIKNGVTVRFPDGGDESRERELPLRIFVVDDFGLGELAPSFSRRTARDLFRGKFDEFVANSDRHLEFDAPDTLNGGDVRLPVSIQVKSLSDLGPDGVMKSVPRLQELAALLKATEIARGLYATKHEFRKAIERIACGAAQGMAALPAK